MYFEGEKQFHCKTDWDEVWPKHLLRFFCCIIRKYLSHILFWSQFVSVYFAMKLFFSFKIHCLQILHLFQTRDGPISFIVTLVYTCCTFFAASAETVCPIYSLVHSSFQSVVQWNSFSPLKYIVTNVTIVSVKEWVIFSDFCRDEHKTFLHNRLCSKWQSWRRKSALFLCSI